MKNLCPDLKKLRKHKACIGLRSKLKADKKEKYAYAELNRLCRHVSKCEKTPCFLSVLPKMRTRNSPYSSARTGMKIAT